MSLWRDRKFSPFFWTQFLGAFNDNLLKNGLITLITFQSLNVFGLSPKLMVPVAGGVFILSYMLFSGIAGQIAEKYEKSSLIRMTKYLEIFVMMIAAYGFIKPWPELLVVALFLAGLQSTLFGPLKFSILPQFFHEKLLVTANAHVQMGTHVAILLGTILGTLLIGLSWGAYAESGALLLVATLGILTSYFIPKAEAGNPKLVVDKNPVTPSLKICKEIYSLKEIFSAVLGISWFWFIGACVLSILPFYTKEVIQGDNTVLSLFLALFSIGIAIGSQVANFFSFKFVERGLIAYGILGIGLFLVLLGLFNWGHNFISPIGISEFLALGEGLWVSFLFLLFSVFGGIFIVPLYTFIQEECPKEFQSRAIACNNIINAVFIILASALIIFFQKIALNESQQFFLVGLLSLFSFIPIFLKSAKYFMRLSADFLVWLLLRCKVRGQENIPDKGAALILCNHISFLDWLILGGKIKRNVHFVMDHAFYKWPLKNFFDWGEVILIAPKNEDKTLLQGAYVNIEKALKNDHIVVLFPEGFISSDGKLQELKAGYLKILQKNPVPVIPMALSGLWGHITSRFPNGKSFQAPFRGRTSCSLNIGKALPPEQATRELIKEKILELRGEKL